MAKKRIYWEGPAEEPSAPIIATRNRFRNELGDAFRYAQWKAYETYHAWEKELATQGEAAAAPVSPTQRDPSRIRDQLIKWISELWQPQWAGRLATAADIPKQEHVFRSVDGEVRISCSWKYRHGRDPAFIHVLWRATFPLAGELWIRFTSPETATVLAEVLLGTRLGGERKFTSDDLGFDPSTEIWAISLLLSECES